MSTAVRQQTQGVDSRATADTVCRQLCDSRHSVSTAVRQQRQWVDSRARQSQCDAVVAQHRRQRRQSHQRRIHAGGGAPRGDAHDSLLPVQRGVQVSGAPEGAPGDRPLRGLERVLEGEGLPQGVEAFLLQAALAGHRPLRGLGGMLQGLDLPQGVQALLRAALVGHRPLHGLEGMLHAALDHRDAWVVSLAWGLRDLTLASAAAPYQPPYIRVAVQLHGVSVRHRARRAQRRAHRAQSTEHTQHRTQSTEHRAHTAQNTEHAHGEHRAHRAQSTEHRVQSTPSKEHRAQSPEHSAQGPEPRAQSTEHRAQSTKHRAQSTEHTSQTAPGDGRGDFDAARFLSTLGSSFTLIVASFALCLCSSSLAMQTRHFL